MEVLVRRKELVAKVDDVKVIKSVLIVARLPREISKLRPANKRTARVDPIPPPNLTIKMEEIAQYLQRKDYVTWSKPLRADRSGKNSSLYFNFHKDVVHTTNAC